MILVHVAIRTPHVMNTVAASQSVLGFKRESKKQFPVNNKNPMSNSTNYTCDW
jgi:hypothetical protein